MAHYGVLTTNLLSTITGLDKSITGSSDRAIVLGDVPNITVHVFQQYLNRSTPYQYAQFVGIPSIQQETTYSCITVNNLALYLSNIKFYMGDYTPTTTGTGNKYDPISMTEPADDNSFTLIYAAEQRITGQPSGFSTPKSAKLTVGSSTYTGIITKSSSTYYSGINSTYGGNMYLIKFSGLPETHSDSESVAGYVDITNSFNAPVSTIWIERVYVDYYTPIYSDYTFNVWFVQPINSLNSSTMRMPSGYSTPYGEFYIDHASLTMSLSNSPDGSGSSPERWSIPIETDNTGSSYKLHITRSGVYSAYITDGSNIRPGYIGTVSFQIYSHSLRSDITYTAHNVRVGTQFLATSTSSSLNLYGMIWVEQRADAPTVGASCVVVYSNEPADIYITLSDSSIIKNKLIN